jgi:hypothetical protein
MLTPTNPTPVKKQVYCCGMSPLYFKKSLTLASSIKLKQFTIKINNYGKD